MTRRSKREVERALEELDGRGGRDGGDNAAIVWRDPETGETTGLDGQPVDESTSDPVMVIEYEGATAQREEP